MQEKLRELYWDNVETIDCIENLCQAIDIQNEHSMMSLISETSGKLQNSFQKCAGCFELLMQMGLPWSMDYLLSILRQLEEAQKNQDYILMGDLYEIQLIPSLQDIQSVIRETQIPLTKPEWLTDNLAVIQKKNPTLFHLLENRTESKDAQCQYSIEPTTIGCYTMALKENERRWYLHSNQNPLKEASQWAKRVYRLDQEQYLLVGWGMGYHVRELLRLYPEMDLIVVEPDLNLLYLSLKYQDWQKELNRISLLCDPNWKQFHDLISEKRTLLLFRPELRHIQNQQVCEQLLRIAKRQDSIDDFKNIFYQNARENIRNCNAYVDKIHNSIQGKKVIIVAGGPSLNRNVEQLKEKKSNMVIIAVGTVFKLLLEKGIPIDYVIVSDGQIYSQIQGVENRQIPILILSTADRRVSRYYQGPKYLVCQKGYKMASEYAEKHNYICYDSGGSVATLALDIGIRLHASEIAFVGLDLAYYGQQLHALGTDQEYFEGSGNMLVEGINGEMLTTNQSFLHFKEWMEKRIQEQDVTMPIIDATEGGARKSGFQQMTLQKFLMAE